MLEPPRSHTSGAFQHAKAWCSQITWFWWAVCSIIQRLPAWENIKQVTSGQVGVCLTHTHTHPLPQHDYIMFMDRKNDRQHDPSAFSFLNLKWMMIYIYESLPKHEHAIVLVRLQAARLTWLVHTVTYGSVFRRQRHLGNTPLSPQSGMKVRAVRHFHCFLIRSILLATGEILFNEKCLESYLGLVVNCLWNPSEPLQN